MTKLTSYRGTLLRVCNRLCDAQGVERGRKVAHMVRDLRGQPTTQREAWAWLESKCEEVTGRPSPPPFVPTSKRAKINVSAGRKPKPAKLPSEPIAKPAPVAKTKKAERTSFYDSDLWREVRFFALKKSDGCCALCGRSKRHHGIVLHVDHIKPRSTHPRLELDVNNLQVLCSDCNLGKSNRDDTDWRASTAK